MTEQGPGAEKQEPKPGNKWLKTLVFVGGMGIILGAAVAVSLLDQPPVMPANEDHVVREEFPNKICMECHDPSSLPDSHPIEYERFECIRCHEATKQALPEGLAQ